MVLTIQKVRENVAWDIDPEIGALELKNQLVDFCNNHWDELPFRVQYAFKYMWDGIYDHFYVPDELPENEWDAIWLHNYFMVERYFESLRMFHQMTPIEIAQYEVDTKDPEHVSQWATAVLEGEIAPEDCYPKPETKLPDNRISPTAQVKERLNAISKQKGLS